MPALRKRPSKDQEAIALISDPHLYRYFDLLAAHREPEIREDGRPAALRAPGPEDLACFILDVEARVYGNRQKVADANRNATLWARKRAVVEGCAGRRLPAAAPAADTVRHWRERWYQDPAAAKAEKTDKAEQAEKAEQEETRRKAETPLVTPPVVKAVLDLASELGVERARQLGHFETDRTIDFADPSPRHSVCMDGTWIAPYSNAAVWTDPDGVEHALRSKATDILRVRQQKIVNFTKKDERKVMGVNHVVGVTRTKYGRVFVGVQRALGGEAAAAVELTERIRTYAGNGLHALIYDKAFHGWTEEWLAAKYGMQVVMPANAARKEIIENKIDSKVAENEIYLHALEAIQSQEQDALTTAAQETLRRTGHAPAQTTPAAKTTAKTTSTTKAKKKSSGKAKKPPKPVRAQIEALAHKRRAERHDLDGLIARVGHGLPAGIGLPLGTSHYVSSGKRLVTVESAFRFYRAIKHPLPDGELCGHDLYVDDGALWDVTYPAGQRIKTTRVTCLTARPVLDPDTGFHRIVSTHQLICAATGHILDFTDAHTPHPERRPGATPKRTSEEKVLALMQPIARCDAKFRKVYGYRNDIESWFSDLKSRFLADKRGPSLDLNHQLLDVLYAGIVTNALALRNYHYEH